MEPTAAAATGRRQDWTGFGRAWLGAVLAGLALGAAATAFVDPLWVFRERPPWLGWTGGANRLLDVEMRRAKPLQLASRPAATVLLGSSVVYRGFDTEAEGGGEFYNLGLSSLMADELPTAAALLRARPETRRVVIGLDYFMFTDFAGPPPLDPSLSSVSGRLRAWIGAGVSLRTLAASFSSGLADAYEPGAWRWSGFKTTPDYPAAVTARQAATEATRVLRYRPEAVRSLEVALRRLAGLDVRIYLSPVSAAQARIADEAGRRAGFETWRREVWAAAARAGASFFDLSRGHPFDDFDPAAGSSAFWLDNLHFKPSVGAWVLDRVGLAGRPETPRR